MLTLKPGAARAADQPRLCTVAGVEFWHVYHARRRISTGTADRAEAQRFLADYIKALRETREPTPVTVAELLSLYLATADCAARTRPVSVAVTASACSCVLLPEDTAAAIVDRALASAACALDRSLAAFVAGSNRAAEVLPRPLGSHHRRIVQKAGCSA